MIVLIAIHAYLLMRSDLYRWFIDDNEHSHNRNDNNDSDYTYYDDDSNDKIDLFIVCDN
jgi:hypothetical protein